MSMLRLDGTVFWFIFAGAALCGSRPANLALRFEEQKGQVETNADFVARGPGYSLLLRADCVELRTREGVVAMTLAGAAAGARPATGQPLPGVSNYLIGRDRSKWRTGVRNYPRVAYTDVYPGIEVQYYGNGPLFEYDFRLAPGADPDAIRLKFSGAGRPVITSAGELRLREGVVWGRPAAYQTAGSIRRPVAARYVRRAAGTIGLSLGAYDRSLPLVIDPQLNYSTLLGGALTDQAYAVATDPAGNAYITGTTLSVNFPTTGNAMRTSLQGSRDAFVSKLDPSGKTLLYSTYLGGNGEDYGYSIAVDPAGSSYITGSTASTNFPISLNAFQSALTGASSIPDAFLTKLNPAGSDIIYSTYFGGAQTEAGYGVAVDGGGNAYVAGRIQSYNYFPIPSLLPPRGGSGDAFVAKFNPTGSGLVFWSFYGGTGLDYANAITLDADNSIYITGETRSGDLPTTTGAYSNFLPGLAAAFVAKFSRSGISLTYATYYGGNSTDAGYGITVDAEGNAYVCGQSTSINLPVRGTSIQTGPAVPPDAFILKLNPLGNSIVYSSYIGGLGEDQCNGIAVDRSGATYLALQTTSSDMPVLAEVTAPPGGLGAGGTFPFAYSGNLDGHILKIDPSGRRLIYASYLGGTQNDSVRGVALGANGDTYFSGFSESTGFQTTPDSLQSKLAGIFDGFLLRLSEVGVSLSPTGAILKPGNAQQFTASVTNARNSTVQWNINPAIGNITQGGQYTAPSSVIGTQTVTVSATSAADPSRFASATVTIADAPPNVVVTVTPSSVALRAGQTQQFRATVTGTTNQEVNWNINPAAGVIRADGLYIAPEIVPVAQTIQVVAISAADPSKSGFATVTLQPVTPAGTITVNPTQTTLEPGRQQQFIATVSGLEDTSVTWTVEPAVGTITSSGLYTAPAAFTGTQRLTVTARSVANPAVAGSAGIALVAAQPRISESGVAHGGTALVVTSQGGVSPGLVIVIYGSTLGPPDLIVSSPDASGSYPASLGGTRVLFDGVPAPMVYTSGGQISAVVPYETANRATTQLQVEYQGVLSNTVSLPVVASAPGFFTADKSGTGQAAALNQDNSFNGTDNPTERNSVVVIFGTGEGQTNPPATTGKIVGSPAPVLRLPASATVAGLAAEVAYVGPAPGLIAGVLQLNVRIPQNAPSGNLPVVVRIGNGSSRLGVTVAVK